MFLFGIKPTDTGSMDILQADSFQEEKNEV
jgi:hypothetical protein